MTPSLIEEADLHALVDGELDAERRRKVEDHLLQHPEDAALVEGWRRQNAALRAAFEPVALETPPLSLREAAARPRPARGAGADRDRRDPLGTARRRVASAAQARRDSREPASAGARLDAADSFRRRRRRGAALLFLASRPAGAASDARRCRDELRRAGRAHLCDLRLDARPVEIDAGRRGELLAWLQGSRRLFARAGSERRSGCG